MANDIHADVDAQDNEQDSDLDTKGEEAEDKPEGDEKPKETPEARLARLERQAEQLRKKLGVVEKKPVESKKESTKEENFGYAEKAYLAANGVKGTEEFNLARQIMEETGKTLDDVLESKYFQSELKEMRETKATADAIPKGTKRSGQSSKDSVDYWLAKGELPPNEPEFQELRRKVVNARYERETVGSNFASNSTGNVLRQSQMKK